MLLQAAQAIHMSPVVQYPLAGWDMFTQKEDRAVYVLLVLMYVISSCLDFTSAKISRFLFCCTLKDSIWLDTVCDHQQKCEHSNRVACRYNIQTATNTNSGRFSACSMYNRDDFQLMVSKRITGFTSLADIVLH